MGAMKSTNGGFVAPPIPKKGEIIREKYQVVDYIGEGGMGVVVLAYHIKLRQHVALKILAPELWEDRNIVARFEREGRAAARMNGVHVARVYDVETTEQGLPFLVMERLQGEDLATKMARIGKLPVQEAVGHALEACEGLAEAHARGVIHRDLKPENLYLARSSDGSTVLKLLDFGISKLMLETEDLDGAVTEVGNRARMAPFPGDSCPSIRIELGIDPRLTSPRAFIGTARYMAPEQVTSAAKVDERTDIWALGVILYELLTGQVPFEGSSTDEVLQSIAVDAVPDICKHGVPADLAFVIGRCLRKDYGERYADVHELAQALAPFAGSDTAARLARIAHFGGKSASVEVRPPSKTFLKSARLPVAVGVALLGIAGWVALVVGRGRSEPTRLPSLDVWSVARTSGVAGTPPETHKPLSQPLAQAFKAETSAIPPSPPANRNGHRGAAAEHRSAKVRSTRNPLHVRIKR